MAAVSAENLVRMVRLELGQDRGYGPGVEISDGQVVYAVRSAIAQYGRYYPKRSIQHFSAPVGTSTYTPNPIIRGIIKINLVRDTQLGLALPELSIIGARIIGTGGIVHWQIPYEYATFLEWKTGAEQVFSQRPAYFWSPEANKIYFYSPAAPLKVYLEGAVEWDYALDEEMLETPNDQDDNEPSAIKVDRLNKTLKEIPANHVNWVRDLSLARSMQILGRMRSKFKSIPTVEGKDTQMDGEELKSEGKELWDKISESMRRSAVSKIGPVFA